MQGEAYTSSFGVQSAGHSGAVGGQTVGYIENGDWAAYSQVSTAGARQFTARVSSGGAGGRIEVRSGSSTGPHLHFEIRDGGDHPLNPAMFLGKAFAEKGDLPLNLAKRYSGRVRIAYVSNIPASKQALMDARADKPIIVKRRETTDVSANVIALH